MANSKNYQHCCCLLLCLKITFQFGLVRNDALYCHYLGECEACRQHSSPKECLFFYPAVVFYKILNHYLCREIYERIVSVLGMMFCVVDRFLMKGYQECSYFHQVLLFSLKPIISFMVVPIFRFFYHHSNQSLDVSTFQGRLLAHAFSLRLSLSCYLVYLATN